MVTVKLKHFFYLSNLLSLLRIFLIIPIYFALAWDAPKARFVLLLLVFLAMLSDYLDGICARWLNQKTDLGKILDPLADKILMAAGFVGLVIYLEYPLTLLLCLGYRDLLIFIGELILSKRTGKVHEASIWGKWNTLIVSIGGFAFIFNPDWIVTIALLILSYLFILISGLSYFRQGLIDFKLVRKFWPIAYLIYLLPYVTIFYLTSNYIL